jgi:hypothetical protein
MKNLIFAILCLSALTVWFSFRGEIVPFERTQKEGWAFFGGTSGELTPGDGENGEVDVFSINSPQETTQTQQKSPISVTVVEQMQTWRILWIGAAAGAVLAELLTAAVFAVLYARNQREKEELV